MYDRDAPRCQDDLVIDHVGNIRADYGRSEEFHGAASNG
jgi:hypothetical protein